MPPSQKLRSFVNAGSTTIHNYYRLCFIYIFHSGVSILVLGCYVPNGGGYGMRRPWRGGARVVEEWGGFLRLWVTVCRRGWCVDRAADVGEDACGAADGRGKWVRRAAVCAPLRPADRCGYTFPAANVRGEFRRIWPEPATSTSASAGVCHTPSFTACAPPSSRPYV
jgi:hypothetical protein